MRAAEEIKTHVRRRRAGGEVINDVGTLKAGRHLATILSPPAGACAMLWCSGIRPRSSPGFGTEPPARWGIKPGGWVRGVAKREGPAGATWQHT